jgi:hypothetical protein
MQELDPCRKLTLLKPEGTQCLGKPKLRWLEPVEEHLKKMALRKWGHMSQDQEEWRMILEGTKVHQDL